MSNLPSLSFPYKLNGDPLVSSSTKETFIDGYVAPHRNPWIMTKKGVTRWVRTGDEAIIDANNDIFIVDRLKEIMKVRGFQVAPAELEGHLLNHSFVSDVCVVGVPDEYNGEVPFAFIAPSAEASEVIKRGEGELVKARIAKVRICLRNYIGPF